MLSKPVESQIVDVSMNATGQLVVSLSAYGWEQLTIDIAKGNPDTPAGHLLNDNNKRISVPTSDFDGARFIFVNDENEMRVLVYNSRNKRLEPTELFYKDWIETRKLINKNDAKGDISFREDSGGGGDNSGGSSWGSDGGDDGGFGGRRATTCSFCGKTWREVGPLVQGPNEIYVCSNCTDL